ncbi:MAG TPA: hypothetical protein ENJ19_08125 [Gammaproteobacteria bacterium]|nr:hypothetical protein [Gammaproteobacteria bacterium]
MKFFLTFLGIALANALTINSVSAADADGQFAIKGVGNATCRQYLAETSKSSPNSFLFAGWLNGYLTAQNQHLKNTFDVTSWETINTLANFLGAYCQNNLDRSFYLAAATMLNALYDQHVPALSKVLTVGKGRQQVRVYEEVLRRAQNKLAELGYLKGKADGRFGPGTRAAILAYQKKLKLEETGVPDQATLFKLLRQGAK